MRFLLSWIKEFLEISLHPEAIADRLTLSGCEVTSINRVDSDWLFEAEITPNRPDLLSHLGIARETAAVLGRQFRVPRWLKKESFPPRGPAPSVPVTIEDREGCRRYVGIVIEGVRIGPSPLWLAQRLTRLNIRPVNNVVDVTNLCLLELGQPLHTFDLDTLEGPSIRIRRAHPKEAMVTIDGESLQLTPDMLVVADSKLPIALAGVMGGRDTEIRDGTKRVFLESAWFDPVRIHATRRTASLSSESSYRFERGVDPTFVPIAAARAARLICSLARGEIKGGLIDIGQTRLVNRQISLRPKRAQEVLGMRIYPEQQKRFLERLGCQVSGTQRGWRVKPPSWRNDLRIPEDLYEELARLWGYERCPKTLSPMTRRELDSHWHQPEDPWIARQTQIRQLLVAAGAQEIYTYSLLNPELLIRCELANSPAEKASDRFGVSSLRTLENPLNVEQASLRPTLLPGALEVLARNLHRKTAESFNLFELGRVYEWKRTSSDAPPPSDKAVSFEKRALGILMAGTPTATWGIPVKPIGLFHLKGIVQLLTQRLMLGPLTEVIESGSGYFMGPGITFRIGDKILGRAGMVDPRILSVFEIPQGIGVAFIQLDLEVVKDFAPAPLRVSELPKVPPVIRDLAIVVSEQTPYMEVQADIEEKGQPLLKNASLFDLYKGSQIPSGMKSLAFRLSFSSGNQTLTDQEVFSAYQKISDSLKAKFKASLR